MTTRATVKLYHLLEGPGPARDHRFRRRPRRLGCQGLSQGYSPNGVEGVFYEGCSLRVDAPGR
jgi:hypothetical protein